MLVKFNEGGASALLDSKTGSDKQPVRTKNLVNQIIRLRFLDPFAGADVISEFHDYRKV